MAIVPVETLAVAGSPQELLVELRGGLDKLGIREGLEVAERRLKESRQRRDVGCEAAALQAVAEGHARKDDHKEALMLAHEALECARQAGDKRMETIALGTAAALHVRRKEYGPAVRISEALKTLYKDLDDQEGECRAHKLAIDTYFTRSDPNEALRAAREFAEFAREASLEKRESQAMQMIVKAQFLRGEPEEARRAARELVTFHNGLKDRTGEAAALMIVAGANPRHEEAIDVTKEALAFFRELGDRSGEATALNMLGTLLIQQGKDPKEAVQFGKEARDIFYELGDKKLGAASNLTVAGALFKVDNIDDAQRAGREALALYRELKDEAGEASALHFVANVEIANSEPSIARLVIDETKEVAIIELDEAATPESLEAAFQELDAMKLTGVPLKVIVLYIIGKPQPPALVSKNLRLGVFLLALRSLGLPIICCLTGKIAGPTWGLFFISDYRIASTDTTFICPPYGFPAAIKNVVGHHSLTMLMHIGPMSAMRMIDLHMVQSCRKNAADARAATLAHARRLCTFAQSQREQASRILQPAAIDYCERLNEARFAGV